MQRTVVLSSIGLALVVSAMIFVSAGASTQFTWMFPACVAWRPVGCYRSHRFEARSNWVGMACTRYRMELMPWVYDWLGQSLAIGAIIFGTLIVAPRPR